MMNLIYYYRKGKKQKYTKNLSTTEICENGFGGICFNMSKQFLICGKICKNVKDLLAQHMMALVLTDAIPSTVELVWV